MNAASNSLPYRWILPLAQILICAAVLWPIRNQLIRFQPVDVRFTFSTGTVPSEPPSPNEIRIVDLDDRKIIRAAKIAELREQIPAFLNLPAMLAVLPYVILNPAKTEWVPRRMDFRSWRAVSWPIVGLFFWWIAGLSIEALVSASRGKSKPHIGWIHTTVGAVVSALGIICLLVPLCGPNDPDFTWTLLSGAGAIWALLGGLPILAHIVQWRMRSNVGGLESTAGLAP